MSERTGLTTDLTRWNRAGLRRFRYVDGNAATHLDVLRQSLHGYFSNWQEVQSEPVSAEEIDQASGRERESLLRKRQQQLLQHYQRESRDMGWLIARSLARACHILTEHADAYANEGYIGTATQWDDVRRMVALLDYHPAPPASASTFLALMAKDSMAGIVAKGYQVKNAPTDGASPIKFETLDDIDIDDALNQLHPLDWNKSQTAISENMVWVDEQGGSIESLDISAGDIGVLLNTKLNTGIAVSITMNAAGAINFALPDFADKKSWLEHHVKLLTAAKDVMPVKINGRGVVEFDRETGLTVGDLIGWNAAGWKFNEVIETDGELVRLDNHDVLPGIHTPIYRLKRIDKEDNVISLNNTIIFPLQYREIVVLDKTGLRGIRAGDFVPVKSPVANIETFNQIKLERNISEIYIHYSGDASMLQHVIAKEPSGFVMAGAPKGFRSGDWVIGSDGNKQVALHVTSIEEREDDFILQFSSVGLDGDLERIYGPLQYTLRPEHFERNEKKLTEGNSIDLDMLPAALQKGRTVMLVCGDKTLVSEVEALAGGTTITLVDNIKADTFIKADTLIYVNVVCAGHGERKPEKILGSGDATQSNQSFIIAVNDVSFIPDASMSSGVRADIDVAVDGQIWQQVSALNDSSPTDIHYTVHMTEEAFLNISFGDGVLARRLPSGKNNIRVAYRLGTGSDGNLDAGSLLKPVKPHAIVKSVVHPVPATGGNAMESAKMLRENAPSTVLTLERAVSIADFSRLAASHSSVWQAGAFVRPDSSGRGELIEVVVVPAEGGELGALESILQDYLLSHALPGVQVTVTTFDSLQPQVDVTLHIDIDQYDMETVEADVHAALLDVFSLQQRKLGQNLYLSEIYAVVENITGVERSICNLREINSSDNSAAEQRVIRAASQRWVIFLQSNDVKMNPSVAYQP